MHLQVRLLAFKWNRLEWLSLSFSLLFGLDFILVHEGSDQWLVDVLLLFAAEWSTLLLLGLVRGYVLLVVGHAACLKSSQPMLTLAHGLPNLLIDVNLELVWGRVKVCFCLLDVFCDQIIMCSFLVSLGTNVLNHIRDLLFIHWVDPLIH